MTNHPIADTDTEPGDADTEPSDDDVADLWNIEQAAHFLHISKRSLFRLLADGEPIPSIVLRGRRFFRREALQGYLDASER